MVTTSPSETASDARPAWWGFVAAMWESGASMHTIAAALNRSPWADDGDRQWHWRQIAAVIAPAPARRTQTQARRAAVQRDGSAVLEALEVERWRGIDLATRIGLHLERGESTATIAARLNRLGLRTERGTRWTGTAVDAFIRQGSRAFDGRPVATART